MLGLHPPLAVCPHLRNHEFKVPWLHASHNTYVLLLGIMIIRIMQLYCYSYYILCIAYYIYYYNIVYYNNADHM